MGLLRVATRSCSYFGNKIQVFWVVIIYIIFVFTAGIGGFTSVFFYYYILYINPLKSYYVLSG
jgi:hypothetical protein